MANTARTQPRAQADVSATKNETQVLDNATVFYEKNKKIINGSIIAVVLIVGGFFGYKYLYMEPREKKAVDKIYFAQKAFMQDSSQVVLKGDGQHPGVLKIMKDYSGTPTANLCRYYAGVSYLREGNYKEAIKHLKEFDGKGTMAQTAAYGALAKAYMGNNDTKNALDNYEKAIAVNKDDNAQTPMFLMEAGIAYEKANQPEKAKAAYLRIRDEYPSSREAGEIDRYLARLGVIE